MNKKVRIPWHNSFTNDDYSYDVVIEYVYLKWIEANRMFDGEYVGDILRRSNIQIFKYHI